jgi:hypothetical protein
MAGMEGCLAGLPDLGDERQKGYTLSGECFRDCLNISNPQPTTRRDVS